MRRAVVLAIAGAAMLGAAKAPASKGPYSAIYCMREPHNGFRYFAGKEQPDGRLMFGVSHWLPNGAATGTYGLAAREGDHWIYGDPPDAAGPEGCAVRIWVLGDGTPRVLPDKKQRCKGGYGEYLSEITFPPRAFYRAVTHELDDPETFEGWAVCGDFSG